MDCRLGFTTSDDVVEVSVSIDVLPRLGERLTIERWGTVWSGIVFSIEHRYFGSSYVVLIDVRRD
jgi:hypothetical protein